MFGLVLHKLSDFLSFLDEVFLLDLFQLASFQGFTWLLNLIDKLLVQFLRF